MKFKELAHEDQIKENLIIAFYVDELEDSWGDKDFVRHIIAMTKILGLVKDRYWIEPHELEMFLDRLDKYTLTQRRKLVTTEVYDSIIKRIVKLEKLEAIR